MSKNYICIHCENKADIYKFCGQCYFRLSVETQNELIKTDGDSWLQALRELDAEPPKPMHGFIDGKAFWRMFYQCPVSKECSIRLEYTGNITPEGIDRLIHMLQLSKDRFI